MKTRNVLYSLFVFLFIFFGERDIEAAPIGGIECLIGYGQRGTLGETGVGWTRVCPLTRYCWEGTTKDIEKVKLLFAYEWDVYYTEFYVRGCGGDFETPIQDPWTLPETPPSLKQPKKHPSEYPKFINLTLAPQVKVKGGDPYWDPVKNELAYKPVVLDLKYTCRRNFCDRAKVDEEEICFAGTELVQVLIDSQKNLSIGRPIMDVRVGDEIMVMKSDGSFDYSPVIALPHQKNMHAATFMQLITPNTDLKLTSQHLVMGNVNACGLMKDLDDFELVPAVSVGIGSCLLTLEGPQEVIDVHIVRERGIYSAVTNDANSLLVVNGIVASPFAVNHQILDILYAPLRLMYTWVPQFVASKMCTSTISLLGSSLMGVSWV